MPDVPGDSGFGRLALGWGCGVVVIYMSLCGVGKCILGDFGMGLLFLIISGLGVYVISRVLAENSVPVGANVP